MATTTTTTTTPTNNTRFHITHLLAPSSPFSSDTTEDLVILLGYEDVNTSASSAWVTYREAWVTLETTRVADTRRRESHMNSLIWNMREALRDQLIEVVVPRLLPLRDDLFDIMEHRGLLEDDELKDLIATMLHFAQSPEHHLNDVARRLSRLHDDIVDRYIQLAPKLSQDQLDAFATRWLASTTQA